MAAQVWVPDDGAVAQICHLLTEFQSPNADQGAVWRQLEAARQVPDFNNYLSHVFAKGEGLPGEVRAAAGLLLKNNLKQQYAATTEDFRTHIKGDLLHVLSHPDRPLRHTAGSIAAAVAAAGGVAAWPELVVWAAHALGSSDAAALDGASDAVYKVAEEAGDQLDASLEGPTWGTPQAASSVLVPPLLALLQHPSADARRGALAALNLMLPLMPRGLSDSAEAFAAGLFALATDPDARVRKEVVAGLVGLLPARPELLAPQMPQLIEYMLAMHSDGDEGVALESAEFWVAFCGADDVDADALRPFLPRLIALLLDKMVFEEHDEEVEEAEADEAAGGGGADDDKDVRPTHLGGGGGGRGGHGGGGGDDEGGGGGGDEDDDDDEPERRWNLRKCSAMGLDHLSSVYGDDILPLLMPIVEARLNEADWRRRESAILALGAVSEGCHLGLAPYLLQIVGMLVPRLEDARPMVRVISCWTLGRYTQWVLSPPDAPEPAPGALGPLPLPAASAELFARSVAGVLARVADRNRHVQQSACSALAVMAEHASAALRVDALAPHLPAILDTVGAALGAYGRRSLRALLDVVGTLAAVVGPPLGDAALAPRYVPALCARWQRQGFAAPESAPVMEAITAVAVAARDRFEPYAPAVFDAAMSVVASMRDAAAAAAAAAAANGAPAGPVIGGPAAAAAAAAKAFDADAYMAALDLLSGLADGLRAGAEPLVARSRLLEVLPDACRDAAPDVRQSAFALLGDLARSCTGHLLPGLPSWVDLCLSQLAAPALSEQSMPAANNAAWALGELAMRAPPAAVAPLAERASAALHFILSGGARVTASLRDNAAITLGRLAGASPDALAPHAGVLLPPWLGALRGVRDDVEKEDAFRGLCRLLERAPDPGWACFPQLAAAFASWGRVADQGLAQEFARLLHGYKAGAGAEWPAMEARVDPRVLGRLRDAYGV